MRKYFFGDSSRSLVSARLSFSSQSEAINFIRFEASDSDTLRELRRWASRRSVSIRSDKQLYEYVASCLVSGQLEVKTLERAESAGQGGGGVVGVAGSGKSASRPVRAHRSPDDKDEPIKVRPRQVAPPEPKAQPKAKIDVDQQVAALKAAAISGAPFCEQCERSRLEEEQTG